jgi:hypothetical protein
VYIYLKNKTDACKKMRYLNETWNSDVKDLLACMQDIHTPENTMEISCEEDVVKIMAESSNSGFPWEKLIFQRKGVANTETDLAEDLYTLNNVNMEYLLQERYDAITAAVETISMETISDIQTTMQLQLLKAMHAGIHDKDAAVNLVKSLISQQKDNLATRATSRDDVTINSVWMKHMYVMDSSISSEVSRKCAYKFMIRDTTSVFRYIAEQKFFDKFMVPILTSGDDAHEVPDEEINLLWRSVEIWTDDEHENLGENDAKKAWVNALKSLFETKTDEIEKLAEEVCCAFKTWYNTRFETKQAYKVFVEEAEKFFQGFFKRAEEVNQQTFHVTINARGLLWLRKQPHESTWKKEFHAANAGSFYATQDSRGRHAIEMLISMITEAMDEVAISSSVRILSMDTSSPEHKSAYREVMNRYSLFTLMPKIQKAIPVMWKVVLFRDAIIAELGTVSENASAQMRASANAWNETFQNLRETDTDKAVGMVARRIISSRSSKNEDAKEIAEACNSCIQMVDVVMGVLKESISRPKSDVSHGNEFAGLVDSLGSIVKLMRGNGLDMDGIDFNGVDLLNLVDGYVNTHLKILRLDHNREAKSFRSTMNSFLHEEGVRTESFPFNVNKWDYVYRHAKALAEKLRIYVKIYSQSDESFKEAHIFFLEDLKDKFRPFKPLGFDYTLHNDEDVVIGGITVARQDDDNICLLRFLSMHDGFNAYMMNVVNSNVKRLTKKASKSSEITESEREIILSDREDDRRGLLIDVAKHLAFCNSYYAEVEIYEELVTDLAYLRQRTGRFSHLAVDPSQIETLEASGDLIAIYIKEMEARKEKNEAFLSESFSDDQDTFEYDAVRDAQRVFIASHVMRVDENIKKNAAEGGTANPALLADKLREVDFNPYTWRYNKYESDAKVECMNNIVSGMEELAESMKIFRSEDD